MLNKNYLILFLLIFSLYSSANDTISNNQLAIQRLDSLSILSVLNEEREPTSAITKTEVAEFFKSGVAITDMEVIEMFRNSVKQYSSFSGYLILESDTIPYLINSKGIGSLAYSSKFGRMGGIYVFYKNKKVIKPVETTVIPQSSIYILGYSKENCDLSYWEEEAKNDPSSMETYQAYKRWNRLKTKNIYEIFNYSKREDEFNNFSYDYAVSFYGLDGILIFENRIYHFMFNAGGVFYFDLLNQFFGPIYFYYACWDKRGLKYLVDYVHRDPMIF